LNVELLTLSEVVEVTGQSGNFSVKVKKNPRYIDMDKCIACGLCAQKCPKRVDDEFNMGVSKRKAAYIKYGQAVPLKYAIDGDQCIFLKRGKCKACEKFCPQERSISMTVNRWSTSISEASFSLRVTSLLTRPLLIFTAMVQIADVVTSLEYERLLSASGPCMGHLVRPSDNTEPRKIAWIQCVGSRNTNRCDNGYCSTVCCMYAIKQSMVTAEHTVGDGLDQTIFYMDIRTHAKECERYLEQAKSMGIKFLRARPHSIEPGPGNIGVTMRYTTEDGQIVDEDFDMAVLSIGMEPASDSQKLADLFKIDLDPYRFAVTSDTNPVLSSRPGIFVTGAFQAPKSIPRSVTEASAAAAEAAKTLIDVQGYTHSGKNIPGRTEC
jgi:heterodisulfide reductase subunit A2